jgi:predicted ATPase/DNA-binding winged helix-turn-helix (wHTH) protein
MDFAGAGGGMKHFESFGLDHSNECLWRNGVQIALPPKPYAVLRYLVDHPGRLITHDELLDALWPETYVQPQVLRTYMLELRKLLGDDAGQPRFIQTLPKRGYCFVAPVTEKSTPELAASQGHSRRASDPASSSIPASDSSRESGLSDRVEAATKIVPSFVSQIVGRDQELARLESQVELLASGQRQIVFVTGEAGIGKTALVDAFAARLQGLTSSALVARGQCIEGFGRKEEYYPVMEALSQLCASPDGDRACRILARMSPTWLAALGRDGSSANPRPAMDRMPGDLCAALEELAAEKPLILIFEDLHWGDESTLHLISALARRRAPARLMVLATFRPHDHYHSEPNGADPARSDMNRTVQNSPETNRKAERPLKSLKQDLLMRRLATEIALAPLTRAAVKELLIRELQQEALPDGLAGFVHRHSEGNPLFVIAILEHLIAQQCLTRQSGAQVGPAGAWEQSAAFQDLEAGVPEGLAQMIELEIERLSPQEQRILEAGSLMSVAFPAWMVAAALNEDAAETEEACDLLSRRLYFVERAGEDELPDGTASGFYVFAHGLYREVLYRRQSVTRRARRHIRVAERLSQLFAGREADVAREMALHYEAAGDWRHAVDALCAAARHAGQRQAHSEAAELLERALEISENLSQAERESTAWELRGELDVARQTLAVAAGGYPILSGKA